MQMSYSHTIDVLASSGTLLSLVSSWNSFMWVVPL